MLLRMQIYDKAQKEYFLSYSLKRTIFIPKCEATNYFRLMTLAVHQSDSNLFMMQRPAASLTDASLSDWLSRSLRYRRVLIWLWKTLLALRKIIRSGTQTSLVRELG